MSKKPTHNLKVIHRGTNVATAPEGMTAQVGVGWINDDGSMSIRLSPGTVLRWDDNLQITAFLISDPTRPRSRSSD